MKEMNSGLIVLLVVLVIMGIACGVMVSQYNGLVAQREQVERGFADIQTQLQRRADLIPNLVGAVSGYMEHEQNIIDSVTASRERLLNTGSIAELAQADSELSKALDSLFVVVENYPELKSNENFIQLQDEIAGTENRIAVARRDYNALAGAYNTSIQKFPAVLLARAFGMDRVEYFQAADSAAEVPHVAF